VTLPTQRDNELYEALKAVYRALRHLPDRLLHRRRHLEARKRLLALQTVRSILVVCHGNICRSPYLEAVLRRELPGANVISAGLVGPDRPVPTHSLTLAAERGLDLSSFRSRPISRVDARELDLVIVMDPNQGRHLTRVFGVSPKRIIVAGDLDPLNAASREIRDPWRQSLAVFRASFDRLDRCAATIVALMPYARHTTPEALSARRSVSTPQRALP
jgi:protein-tyrosine phosphatase